MTDGKEGLQAARQKIEARGCSSWARHDHAPERPEQVRKAFEYARDAGFPLIGFPAGRDAAWWARRSTTERDPGVRDKVASTTTDPRTVFPAPQDARSASRGRQAPDGA